MARLPPVTFWLDITVSNQIHLEKEIVAKCLCLFGFTTLSPVPLVQVDGVAEVHDARHEGAGDTEEDERFPAYRIAPGAEVEGKRYGHNVLCEGFHRVKICEHILNPG